MGILYLSVDKMKLTITFLSCLVCMTCAQYGYPQYGGYLAHQYFQQDPYYQQGYAPQQAVYYQPNLDYPAQEVGVQARIPARVQSTNPDGRFFGLLSSINFVPTVTSSIFATVTSTGTVGSVQSCIDVGDFAAGLTTACRRRRRADMELLDTLNIQTSEIETIKTSAVPQLTKREVEPVIVSSFESQANDEVFGEKREGRLFGASFVSTVFSTITSWSLTTTTAKATAKFAKETSVLSCLPAGYIVC